MSKKESSKSVLDLERLGKDLSVFPFGAVRFRYLNQPVKVKFSGGREVKGILKGPAAVAGKCGKCTRHSCCDLAGHDAVANLVLDDVQDFTVVNLMGKCCKYLASMATVDFRILHSVARNIFETQRTHTRCHVRVCLVLGPCSRHPRP